MVAGAINSLAGGGGLITFPLLALVLPLVIADATSAFALLTAYPAAVWRTRGELTNVPTGAVDCCSDIGVSGGALRRLLRSRHRYLDDQRLKPHGVGRYP